MQSQAVATIESKAERPYVVDSFLTHLQAYDLDTVFGIPGGLLAPFFMAVEQTSEMRLVVSKHEQGAAFMADGFYRASGRPAVAAATSGPGATNLMTAVSCAFADGVPMLVLTGQVNSANIGRGACQEMAPADIDVVSMFRPITKYSVAVDSPHKLLFHFRRAMRMALSGRPGPVHLNVPVDFWKTRTEPSGPDARHNQSAGKVFDRDRVQEAARAIAKAKYPLFVVGSGVACAHSRDKLRELVDHVNARVVTSPRGKGILADDHPASGGVFGLGGADSASRLVQDSRVDLLFAIGASLGETTAVGWDQDLVAGRTVLQLDIDEERIGRNFPVDVPLLGDAGTILTELLFHIDREQETALPQSRWTGKVTVESEPSQDGDLALSGLHPLAWRQTLAPLFPDDCLIFSDIGGHMLFNLRDLPITKEQRFIINMGFASMGHGTVAPIGAAFADAKRPIVAIVGDACMAMNGNELLTAAEYGVNVIWIVENNQMHGISWHGSKLDDRQLESIVYKREVNIAEIARAMGVPACRVTSLDDLEPRFAEALREPGPFVIEIMTNATVSPPVGARVKSFAGFKSS